MFSHNTLNTEVTRWQSFYSNNLKHTIMFKVLKVSASKSRTGGANINCQEIVKHAVFGNCNGKEFIIQSDTMPDEAIVGTEMNVNVRFEDVEYTFMKNGEQVTAKYTRGIPC